MARISLVVSTSLHVLHAQDTAGKRFNIEQIFGFEANSVSKTFYSYIRCQHTETCLGCVLRM